MNHNYTERVPYINDENFDGSQLKPGEYVVKPSSLKGVKDLVGTLVYKNILYDNDINMRRICYRPVSDGEPGYVIGESWKRIPILYDAIKEIIGDAMPYKGEGVTFIYSLTSHL